MELKEITLLVQKELNERGLNAGPPDGIIGPNTIAAIRQLGEIPEQWSDGRKVIGALQVFSRAAGFKPGPTDGYIGPNSLWAFEQYQELQNNGQNDNWRGDEEPTDVKDAAGDTWPQQTANRSEIIKFYGEVGQNQTSIKLPYTHRLSWNTAKTLNSFKCHEKVHDSLERVLKRVLVHYGEEQIKNLGLDLWGGCLNVRPIRGGKSHSMHSWGIAIDYDPDRNKLKWGSDRAIFAKPEYEQWWKFWEEEGWVSLGRAKNYDWMHVQAAKL